MHHPQVGIQGERYHTIDTAHTFWISGAGVGANCLDVAFKPLPMYVLPQALPDSAAYAIAPGQRSDLTMTICDSGFLREGLGYGISAQMQFGVCTNGIVKV